MKNKDRYKNANFERKYMLKQNIFSKHIATINMKIKNVIKYMHSIRKSCKAFFLL